MRGPDLELARSSSHAEERSIGPDPDVSRAPAVDASPDPAPRHPVAVARVLALGFVASLACLWAVLWAFFPMLLPGPVTDLQPPFRWAVPFLVMLASGLAVGYAARARGVLAGVLVASPGFVLGGALGVLSSLRPHHLLIVAAMVIGAVTVAGLGGWLGARAARRKNGRSGPPAP